MRIWQFCLKQIGRVCVYVCLWDWSKELEVKQGNEYSGEPPYSAKLQSSVHISIFLHLHPTNGNLSIIRFLLQFHNALQLWHGRGTVFVNKHHSWHNGFEHSMNNSCWCLRHVFHWSDPNFNFTFLLGFFCVNFHLNQCITRATNDPECNI